MTEPKVQEQNGNITEKPRKVNLIVMAYMWGACSFSYYMIVFKLKYLPGDIFENSLASGLSEFISLTSAGFLYTRLGIKMSFVVLFGLAILGGTLILTLGEDD